MAVDATGTVTSPDSIPTYNTAADNPSGKGLNSIVAAIQTALSNRVSKPSGIVSGEVPIWNGSAFVRGALVSAPFTTVTGANTDVAWGGSNSASSYLQVSTGGGSARSLGAGLYAGQRVIIRNNSASNITILHATGGGTGAQFFNRSTSSVVLLPNEDVEYVYDGGSFWAEIGRDQAAASAGATTLIASSVAGGAVASFDTNTLLGGNIPGSYNNLVLKVLLRGDAASPNLWVRLNNDSGTNYNSQQTPFQGGVAVGAPATSLTAAQILIGGFPGTGATASRAATAELTLNAYAGTTFHKEVFASLGQSASDLAAGQIIYSSSGAWKNAAAVTRITLLPDSGNFIAGSAFYLYGLT